MDATLSPPKAAQNSLGQGISAYDADQRRLFGSVGRFLLGVVDDTESDVKFVNATSTHQKQTRRHQTMSDTALVERVTQLEKDVDQLSELVTRLIMWKRNQATRILPKTNQDATIPDGEIP